MKLKFIKQDIIKKLSDGGIENPSLEAFLLIEKFTGLDKVAQIMKADEEIKDTSSLFEATEKRISGSPMAYILRHREFYGLDFYIDENVLIPRADTETLVEEGINFLKNREGTFLDLCTGSGCIGVSVSYNTKTPVVLADISPSALAVCIAKAERYIKNRYAISIKKLFIKQAGSDF